MLCAYFFLNISNSFLLYGHSQTCCPPISVFMRTDIWGNPVGNTLFCVHTTPPITWTLLYNPLLPHSMYFLSTFKYKELGAFNTNRTNKGLSTLSRSIKSPLQEASDPLLSNSRVLIHRRRARKDTRPLGLAESIRLPVHRPEGSCNDLFSVPNIVPAITFETRQKSSLRITFFLVYQLHKSMLIRATKQQVRLLETLDGKWILLTESSRWRRLL